MWDMDTNVLLYVTTNNTREIMIRLVRKAERMGESVGNREGRAYKEGKQMSNTWIVTLCCCWLVLKAPSPFHSK